MSKPLSVMAVYRPKAGKEDALLALVEKHWPVLAAAGLVTDEPALIWRATDKKTKSTYFVEIFAWKDEASPGLAHQMPEVMQIWEPMGVVLEGNGGPELAMVERIGA